MHGTKEVKPVIVLSLVSNCNLLQIIDPMRHSAINNINYHIKKKKRGKFLEHMP